jgi:CBS domain-containing protein
MESVRHILNRKGREVWSLAPESTVFEAVAMMAERGVGALIVVDEGKVAGVISERDYARKVVLKGHASREVRVGEIMSHPVITVTPDHTVEECMRIATDHRIRHLPVIEAGKLVGVVSIGDLVRSTIMKQQETISHLTDYIAGKYPA